MYNEKQIEDLTNTVKEITAAKEKAVGLFSNIVTPELEDQMTPKQKSFIAGCKSAFTDGGDSDFSNQMKELQRLIKMGENIT